MEYTLDQLVNAAVKSNESLATTLKVPIRQVSEVPAVSISEKIPPLDAHLVIECHKGDESGDALLFQELYKDRVVYDPTEKQWYIWAGHHWKPDESNVIRLLIHNQLAAQYIMAAGAVRQQANTPSASNPFATLFPQSTNLIKSLEELVDKLYRKQRKLKFKTRRNNILDIAEPLLSINNRDWDANPWLLGCKNGVLNLEENNLHFRAGQPSDYIRIVSPTEWRGIQGPSILDRLIPELFDDRTPTEKDQIVSYLRRLLGYGVTGWTSEDMFCILYGEHGRNGKDTILKMVEKTIGDELAGPVDKKVAIRNKNSGATSHIMDLRGKRLVWINETTEGEVLAAGQVKYLTGGGTITAREIYQKQTVFEPSHTMMIMTNFKPHANADDKALWERISLVTFNLSFVANPTEPYERQRDPNLKKPLTDAQRSDILAFLVRGCVEWQQQGLNLPKSLSIAREAYKNEEDTLGNFIEDCCELEANSRLPAKELYKAYVEWSTEEGVKPMSNAAFGRKMGKRFKRKKSGGRKHYLGIDLKQDLAF